MLSYHNDENLKNLVVLEMKKHQDQDQFIKGCYGHHHEGKFKGCSIGCTIDSVNIILGKSYDTYLHKVLEESIGIPEWLSLLQDELFEGLPNDEGSQFSVDFLSAIPVGADLESVKWKFCSFILKESIDVVLKLPDLPDELRKKVVDVIRGVLAVHESAISTGNWDIEAAAAARAAAVEAEAETGMLVAAAAAVAKAACSAKYAAEAAVQVSSTKYAAAAGEAMWSVKSATGAAAAVAVTSADEAFYVKCVKHLACVNKVYAAMYKRYSAELIRLLKSI